MARPAAIPHGYFPHRRAFDEALREAGRWEQQALEDAARDQEALESWDPAAGNKAGVAGWLDWRARMARDLAGYLRRAKAQAERAAALARTPAETYRATVRLALLECRLGHHDVELRQARRLMALEPRNELSLLWLRRAARCNGLKTLEQQAGQGLAALVARSRRRAHPPFLSWHPPTFGEQPHRGAELFGPSRSDPSIEPAGSRSGVS